MAKAKTTTNAPIGAMNSTPSPADGVIDAPVNLPSPLGYGDFEMDAGAHDSKDVLFPYLLLLQAISPQLAVEDFKGRAGDFFLQGQDAVYHNKTNGFVFHAAYHRKEYVEWRPRKDGGGIVNRYDVTNPLVAKYSKTMGKVTLPNGNELIETVYLYGVVDDAESGYPACVLPFKKTALKKWRQHSSRVSQMFYGKVDRPGTPGDNQPVIPGFAIRWRITSAPETANGQTFFNIEIKLEGAQVDRSCLAPPNAPAVQKAKELRHYMAELYRQGNAPSHQGAEEMDSGVELAHEIPF